MIPTSHPNTVMDRKLEEYQYSVLKLFESEDESVHVVKLVLRHYRVGQKNRGHFVLRPITLEILNRSLPNLSQIKVNSF